MSVEELAAGLTKAQREAILLAMPCEYAGTYVGNCGAETMSRLSKAGLFKEKPEDGGGTWGVVARLNDTGLAVRSYLMENG